MNSRIDYCSAERIALQSRLQSLGKAETSCRAGYTIAQMLEFKYAEASTYTQTSYKGNSRQSVRRVACVSANSSTELESTSIQASICICTKMTRPLDVEEIFNLNNSN